MPDAKPATRRRHDAELKARVLDACGAPGASVAQVAMAHGLNANLVHKWRRDSQVAAGAVPAAFIELPMPRAAMPICEPEPRPDIRIELKRGATSVSINWPADCAAECAAWLRELLK
jgi:transposase